LPNPRARLRHERLERRIDEQGQRRLGVRQTTLGHVAQQIVQACRVSGHVE
jgi:hypothetical protein